MSKNNTVFEKLLKEITDSYNLSEQDVALAVGRNAGYIAQLRSRIKKGEEVPKKFLDLLRLHYAMEKSQLPPSKDEEIIAIKGAIKVIMLKLVQLESLVTKGSSATISLELEKMTKQVVKQLIDEASPSS